MAYILLLVAVLSILSAAYLMFQPSTRSSSRKRPTNRGWRADRGRVILMTSGPKTRVAQKTKVHYLSHESINEDPIQLNGPQKTIWKKPGNLFPQKGSVEETLSKVTSRIPKQIAHVSVEKVKPAYSHDEIEVRPESELHQEAEPLTAAEHLSNFDRYVYALAKLVRDSKERIRNLEGQFIDQLSSTNSEFNSNIVTARRIIGALESRLARLNELNPHNSQDGFSQSKSLLKMPLVIPRDAVNALLSAEELPPLQPNQWESAVENFISKAEHFLAEASRNKKKTAGASY